ncbi:MAG: hypothetical protein HN348_31445, partial [Proteobacteria bacterium]|nr:hypothetical protein [Pseudomonadota bacterium]
MQIEGLPTPNPILDFVEGVQTGLDVWRTEINADVVFDVEEEGVGGFINEVGHDIATPDPDLGYWDPQINGKYEVFAQTFSIDDSEFHSYNIVVFSALVSPTDSQLIEWTNVVTDPSEMHLPTVIAHEFGHCLDLD